MEAKGVDGQVSIVGEHVRISRRGVMAVLTHGFASDRNILIDSITLIEFRVPRLSNGYIRLTFSGASEGKATRDANTVMFTRRQCKAFEDVPGPECPV